VITAPPTLSPYPGPRAFEPGESTRFFGRRREIRDLAAMVVSYPVVLFYAPSGTGKTSLLQAGLIPRLIGEKHVDVLPVGRVRRLLADDIGTEGENVYVTNLLTNWRRELDDAGGSSTATASARRARRVPQAPSQGGKRLATTPAAKSITEFLADRERAVTPEGVDALRAVVIDQLEELLTLYPERWEQRGEFFRDLATALREDPLLRVILSLREDHLARLDRYAPLLPDRLRARFRLELLTRNAALEAVVCPLEGIGSFEEGVPERLVDDLREYEVPTELDEDKVLVKGEFVEPVALQVACAELWSALPRGETEITQAQLDELGSLDRILSRFYERAIESAAKKAQQDPREVRRWFERVFITSLGTRGMVYQTPRETAGMPNAVIDELLNHHVIRAEERAGATWFELTHDRFIRPVLDSNRDELRPAGSSRPDEEQRRKANVLLAQAEEARLEGRLEAAERAAKRAGAKYDEINDSLGAATALTKLSEIEFGAGRPDNGGKHGLEAVALYEQAGDLFSAGETLRLLARYQTQLSRFDDAISSLESAVTVYGGDSATADLVGQAFSMAQMAHVRLWQDRTGEAVASAQEAVELALRTKDPSVIAQTREWEGYVHRQLGDIDAAVAAFETALEERERADDLSGAVYSLRELPTLYLQLGRDDDALAAAELGLRLAEGLGDAVAQAGARLDAASALRLRGDEDAAMRHLDRAIELHPTAVEPWRQRAVLHWDLWNLDHAHADFNNALVQAPGDLVATAGRGQVLAELGQGSPALKDLERALELVEEGSALHAEAQAGRGLALATLYRRAEAWPAFDAALAARHDSGRTYFYRARAHDLAGDETAARADYERATTAADPPLPPAYRRLIEQRLTIVDRSYVTPSPWARLPSWLRRRL
jgi:tetratricopeptide (TPR) repeat protein